MEQTPIYQVEIAATGQRFAAAGDRTLLQSAELAGLELASSCRNGTCRTCIGQLDAGNVAYRIEWPGLSAQEKAERHVLPCVAYPRSDIVLNVPTI